MDEVLKRKLFNTPKYEHKSTGIASGLEYRPGYKVGGRVGLHSGGPPHDHPEDFVDKLTNLIPMARMANIDEYKGAVVFSCSSASSYMTGHNLVLDGGRSLW